MPKGFLCYHLLAEPPQWVSAHQRVELRIQAMTYASHPLQPLMQRCPYYLYRNVSVTIISLPYVQKTALTQRDALLVIIMGGSK